MKSGISDETWFENGGTVIMEKVYTVNSDISINDKLLKAGSVISIVNKEDNDTFVVNTINYSEGLSFEIDKENLELERNKLEYNESLTKLWNKLYNDTVLGTMKVSLVGFVIKIANALMCALTFFVLWITIVKAQTPIAYLTSIIYIVLSYIVQFKILPVQSTKMKLQTLNNLIHSVENRIGDVKDEIEKLGYKREM